LISYLIALFCFQTDKEEATSMKHLTIHPHATERFMFRNRSSLTTGDGERQIATLFDGTEEEIIIADRVRRHEQMLEYDLVGARYFHCRGDWVAVVVNGEIKTIYRFIPEKWAKVVRINGARDRRDYLPPIPPKVRDIFGG